MWSEAVADKNGSVETKPIVFVTQVPNRRDKETGVMTPSVNISPAGEHGEIRILMPPSASFFATAELVSQLRAGLRDYDFDRGDSVISLGDPAVIAVIGALLAQRHKSFAILRWDKNSGRYNRIKITV